jgi:hypothetical protein
MHATNEHLFGSFVSLEKKFYNIDPRSDSEISSTSEEAQRNPKSELEPSSYDGETDEDQKATNDNNATSNVVFITTADNRGHCYKTFYCHNLII